MAKKSKALSNDPLNLIQTLNNELVLTGYTKVPELNVGDFKTLLNMAYHGVMSDRLEKPLIHEDGSVTIKVTTFSEVSRVSGIKYNITQEILDKYLARCVGNQAGELTNPKLEEGMNALDWIGRLRTINHQDSIGTVLSADIKIGEDSTITIIPSPKMQMLLKDGVVHRLGCRTLCSPATPHLGPIEIVELICFDIPSF